ncbi:MAG: DUF4320 family protein [Oscillospiraceae bacterium]
MKSKIKEQKGELALHSGWTLLLVVGLLIVALSALSVATTANKVHMVASELSRYIEVRGQLDSSVPAEFSRLCRDTGIEAHYTAIAPAGAGYQKIQFGERFTVEVTATKEVGLGGIVKMPIPLTSTAVGRSEQFWK